MLEHFLTQSVDILSLTASTATTWGANPTWSISTTKNGRLRYLSGREVYISDREAIQATHRLYIDYTTGITVKNRVQADSMVYDVKMVTRPTNADFLQVDVEYLPNVTVTT